MSVLATPSKAMRGHPARKIIMAGHGKIVANSADAPKLDGLNASCVIFDELHRQDNRFLWDVMTYSMAARTEPLIISVTTAGESESDDQVWYEQKRYSEQVEAGVIQDPTHLGIIYEASEDDDIDSPVTSRKANPSLGVTFSEDDFRRDLEEAKTSPAKLQNFKRLRLTSSARVKTISSTWATGMSARIGASPTPIVRCTWALILARGMT